MKVSAFNFRSLFSRFAVTASKPTPPPPQTTTATAAASATTTNPPIQTNTNPTGTTTTKTTTKPKTKSLLSIIKLFSSHRPKRVHYRRYITLNMNTNLPRIFITADTNEFDPSELAQWQAEGYEVVYIPRADNQVFELLGDALEGSEKYCIIAYGTAATLALQYALYPVGNLVALIAYYPTGLPSTFPSEPYPERLRRILIQIPDGQTFNPDVTKHTQCLKFQLYQNAKPGFAEKLTANYNPIAAGLAHSRTLAVVRDTLGPELDLEEIWGEHLLAAFVSRNANKTLDSMVKEPYVNHVPTLVGGSGYDELHDFYHNYFIPTNPPSLSLQQISRTVGSDRIVDEMICRFKHTTEMIWMLPGVKPTGRRVEIPIVIIACIKAKKVYAENVYWDQASVLKQIGVVDFTGLPVSGPESAWKVEDKDSVPANILLGGGELQEPLTNDESATVTEGTENNTK
ncbi:hypothetical protein TWF730_007998 [Orbilia blumenaviensis]|uniref:Carboxymethylenebutenolidase n=1 Tax=Orbilia blumenaviensis TaxID=1796055 RepID=A0AAV9VG11_9PEZI